MSEFVFAGSQYRNVTEMCDAIAQTHLSASGRNGRAQMREYLAEFTDAEFAAEAIECWFGAASRSGASPPAEPSFAPDELARAFGRLRDPAAFTAAFGADTESEA